MGLCSGRPEGFGPHSAISAPIPTTCFVDTILIPLPVWIALALLPILLLLSLHRRKVDYNPSTVHLRAHPHKSWSYTLTATIYYLLILANILMQTLVIVRLALIHYDITLLPFAYVGLLIGALLHWTQGLRSRIRGWQIINGVLWIGGMVMTIISAIGLANEGINMGKGSKYPVSDQVTDVAVMAGVYAVIAILEAVLGAWRVRRAQAQQGEMVGSGSPVQLEKMGSR